MPRIEDIKSNFKKKEYRAWDSNLLDALKIPKNETDNTNSIEDKDKTVSLPNDQTQEKKPKSNSLNEVQLGFNKGSNKVQLESNHSSNRVQSGFNKGANEVQLESIQGSNRVQNETLNRGQLGSNDDPGNISGLISKLGGNEHKIFFCIVDICVAKGGLSTGDIPGKILMAAANTTRNGMETALKRLKKKGLLFRSDGKTGKNGQMNLLISEHIKNQAIKFMRLQTADHELFNWSSIRVQNAFGNRVQLESHNSLYNSSSNKYKTTITELPEEWKKINVIPLESIGFSEQHLLDIFRTNSCDPDMVQESIYHFAFGLEQGKYKTYDDPLKVLIGRLRKGSPWFESNYESPKIRAMRELVERKKAEKDKVDAMIKELSDLEFPNWRKKLSENEIQQILPADILKTNLPAAVTATLRAYFVDKILIPRLVTDGLIVE
jgi:hypothetical protein